MRKRKRSAAAASPVTRGRVRWRTADRKSSSSSRSGSARCGSSFSRESPGDGCDGADLHRRARAAFCLRSKRTAWLISRLESWASSAGSTLMAVALPRESRAKGYSCGWKRRSLVDLLGGETRLAVKLATQPDSNSTRDRWRCRPSARGRAIQLGANLPDGGFRQREYHVEIVNHQVEDYVDVERARREDGKPVGLEEHGARDALRGRGDGRVEALEVTDLQDAMVAPGEREDAVWPQ